MDTMRASSALPSRRVRLGYGARTRLKSIAGVVWPSMVATHYCCSRLGHLMRRSGGLGTSSAGGDAGYGAVPDVLSEPIPIDAPPVRHRDDVVMLGVR